MKTCKALNCPHRAVKDYCVKEHNHLNPKKEKLPFKRTPVNKQSKKLTTALQQYRKQRIEFLKYIPNCEVKAEGCTNVSSEVHHRAGRIGDNLLNVSTWLSVCHNCHQKIELNPLWAKEHGFSISRLNKAS